MTQDSESLVGQLIGSQFRILRQLGSGGMGSVYLAEQIDMERKVVVKLLHPEFSFGNSVVLERFRREAKAVAQLNHPNIVQVFVFGQADSGQLFLAMEYIEGRDLAHDAAQGPMPQPRALRILDQVCSALIEAHGAGIVHRDLKPENIMLADRYGNPDYVKVLDFGIAKLHRGGDSDNTPTLTQAGSVFGTPRYMSPEQVRGEKVDARCDLYALGIILYELLVGRHPFEAHTTIDYLLKHISEPIPAPSTTGLTLTPRVEALLMRCVEKDAHDRFQSAAELQREVRLALRDFPESIRGFSTENALINPARGPVAHALAPTHNDASSAPTTPPPSPKPPPKRRPPAWLWAAAALLVIGGGIGLYFALKPQAPSTASPAPVVAAPTSPSPNGPTPAGGDPDPSSPNGPTAPGTLDLGALIADFADEELRNDPDFQKVSAILGKLEGIANDDPKATRRQELLALLGGPTDAPSSDPPSSDDPPQLIPPEELFKDQPGAITADGAIDGFPLPAGARPSTSTPQVEMFETAADARALVAFYKDFLSEEDFAFQAIPNGLLITTESSPFSSITLTPNGDRLWLVFARNALAPAPAQPAVDGAFGVSFPAGVSLVMRSEQAVVMRSRRPLAEVCAFFEKQLGSLAGVMTMKMLDNDPPLCTFSVTNGQHPWMSVTAMADPTSPGAVMISVAPPFN